MELNHKAKKILREEIFTKRDLLSIDYYRKANDKITEKILELPLWREAKTVFMFQSLPHEFNTAKLIQEARHTNKCVALPVSNRTTHRMDLYAYPEENKWQYGAFNIKEPSPTESRLIAPHEVDLVVVPCVTCTHTGKRLGHGGGFYDRWLAENHASSLIPYFERLTVTDLPTNDYDQQVDRVVTEAGCYGE